MKNKRQLIITLGLGFVLLLISGCSSTNEADDQEATAQALSESIFQTATAAAEAAFDPAANQGTAEAEATAVSEAALFHGVPTHRNHISQ